MWFVCVEVYKHSWGEEEKGDAVNIIDVMCISDISKEREIRRAIKVKISNGRGWEYGAGSVRVEESE